MEVEIANATDAEMSVTSRGIARTTAEEMMTRSKFYFAPPGIEMSCNPPDWWFFHNSLLYRISHHELVSWVHGGKRIFNLHTRKFKVNNELNLRFENCILKQRVHMCAMYGNKHRYWNYLNYENIWLGHQLLDGTWECSGIDIDRVAFNWLSFLEYLDLEILLKLALI